MTNLTVTKQGQVNLAGDEKALFLKMFSGEVINTFNATNVYRALHKTRQISAGKSASFPAIGKVSANYHVPGTQLVGTPVAHNERIITIDDLLLANVMIADIFEAMNHYDVRAEYSKQMGQALSVAYDKNVARVAVKAAREAATITGQPGGSQIVGGANVRTDGALIKAALFAAAQTFDEKDVPSEGRSAVMRPVSYYAAAATTDLVNKDWGGSGGIAAGKIESLAGIDIVKSNHVPNTDESAATGVPAKYLADFSKTAISVFTREAAGTVSLMDLSMQSDYLMLYQATGLVARYAVGHGILQPECAIEVVTTA